MVASAPVLTLPEPEWLARRAAHERRVRVWTDPHLARRARGEKHPTEDFLWEYYGYRASWLKRWHPGPDVVLLGPAAREYLRWPEYRETGGGVGIDPAAFPAARRDSLRWLRELLQATAGRPPQFACYALHEWAMVHRLAAPEIRHPALPLRFPLEEIARITESLPIRCSHFDAFRFFSPAARPLNRLQPERATIPLLEQRGCLHANMDLYKWAFKLTPFTPGELLADCFAFAREIREVDMRASPYDVRGQGLAPIPIETPAGRAEFEALQSGFAGRSQPLRARLLALCEQLLAASPAA
ncbi:MAG: 3-methyladenine DNA glycosylase [Opitutales bacterium]